MCYNCFEVENMIKTKYDKMSKIEKKDLLEKYKKTDNGKVMMDRLYRLMITGIISLLFSIGLFVFQYKKLELMDYLTIIPLFLAGILFIMMSFKLKRKVLIQYAIKK